MIANNGKFYLVANVDKHDNVIHFRVDKITEVKITPVTKAELPPLTDDALKVFGDFGWLIKERYEAI